MSIAEFLRWRNSILVNLLPCTSNLFVHHSMYHCLHERPA